MSDAGFNGTQLKQLKGLFAEVKTEFKEVYKAMGKMEENLGELIDKNKKELSEKIESEVYVAKIDLKNDIKNLALTMATKYEVKQLQKKAGIRS